MSYPSTPSHSIVVPPLLTSPSLVVAPSAVVSPTSRLVENMQSMSVSAINKDANKLNSQQQYYQHHGAPINAYLPLNSSHVLSTPPSSSTSSLASPVGAVHSPPLFSSPSVKSRTARGHACHLCRTDQLDIAYRCSVLLPTKSKRRCAKIFCKSCIDRQFIELALSDPSSSASSATWQCPACLDMCRCANCRRSTSKASASASAAAAVDKLLPSLPGAQWSHYQQIDPYVIKHEDYFSESEQSHQSHSRSHSANVSVHSSRSHSVVSSAASSYANTPVVSPYTSPTAGLSLQQKKLLKRKFDTGKKQSKAMLETMNEQDIPTQNQLYIPPSLTTAVPAVPAVPISAARALPPLMHTHPYASRQQMDDTQDVVPPTFHAEPIMQAIPIMPQFHNVDTSFMPPSASTHPLPVYNTTNAVSVQRQTPAYQFMPQPTPYMPQPSNVTPIYRTEQPSATPIQFVHHLPVPPREPEIDVQSSTSAQSSHSHSSSRSSDAHHSSIVSIETSPSPPPAQAQAQAHVASSSYNSFFSFASQTSQPGWNARPSVLDEIISYLQSNSIHQQLEALIQKPADQLVSDILALMRSIVTDSECALYEYHVRTLDDLYRALLERDQKNTCMTEMLNMKDRTLELGRYHVHSLTDESRWQAMYQSMKQDLETLNSDREGVSQGICALQIALEMLTMVTKNRLPKLSSHSSSASSTPSLQNTSLAASSSVQSTPSPPQSSLPPPSYPNGSPSQPSVVSHPHRSHSSSSSISSTSTPPPIDPVIMHQLNQIHQLQLQIQANQRVEEQRNKLRFDASNQISQLLEQNKQILAQQTAHHSAAIVHSSLDEVKQFDVPSTEQLSSFDHATPSNLSTYVSHLHAVAHGVDSYGGTSIFNPVLNEHPDTSSRHSPNHTLTLHTSQHHMALNNHAPPNITHFPALPPSPPPAHNQFLADEYFDSPARNSNPAQVQDHCNDSSHSLLHSTHFEFNSSHCASPPPFHFDSLDFAPVHSSGRTFSLVGSPSPTPPHAAHAQQHPAFQHEQQHADEQHTHHNYAIRTDAMFSNEDYIT